ncbi:MazG-like family protein [Kitasatospora sp. NBC_00240]|nr:MazG-like family protein [Kitasatospora sp. NBC_00240]
MLAHYWPAIERHVREQDGAFATIRRLVDWLDHANGTGEAETAMRLLKLTEEVGEVSQAYIGFVGQNPRKGQTHTRNDVADELCDVIVTALVALHAFTDDAEQHFAGKLQHIADRVLTAGEGRHAECTEPHPGVDGYTDCDGQPL